MTEKNGEGICYGSWINLLKTNLSITKNVVFKLIILIEIINPPLKLSFH